MDNVKVFEHKRVAKVTKNKAGLFCVVVSGPDIKSPIPGVKNATRFYGCRAGETGKAKSIEIAEKLAKAPSLPKAGKK